jgi:hypothetical protein
MLFNKKITCSCGHENPAGSQFCGACGKKLAGSANIICPACGAKLNQGTSFCGKCGAKLQDSPQITRTADTSKELGKNRQWMRMPGDFAQRFDIQDLRGVFAKRLTVEHGTKAILLQGGIYKGTLPAGVYNLGNIFDTIGQLRLDERTTVILVDAGEIPLTFMIPKGELRSKNAISVGAAGKVTAQIKDPVAFLENYLKREQHVSIADIENYIHSDLKNIAQNKISQYNIEELYGNAVLSQELSNEFKKNLNANFGNKGIEISHLNCVGFDEGAWKEVLGAREDLQIEIGKAKAEYEKKAYLREAGTEDAVGQIHADHTIKSLDQELGNQRVDANFGHELARDSKKHDHELEKDRKEIEQLLEFKKQNKAIKREDERQHIANLSEASIEVLISMVDDQKIGALVQLELAKRANSLTPEQILAMNAKDPKAAADALASRAKLESVEQLNEFRIKDQQAFNTMMQSQYKENAEQMKEVMNSALNAMGNTATARSTAQNPGATVVSGGMGTPVVVNVAPEGSSQCKYCSANVPNGDVFCPSCGKKQE